MILRLGRSPGEGNGYPIQYSCLDNSMDRGAWRAIQSMGSQESDATKQLTLSHYILYILLKNSKKQTNKIHIPEGPTLDPLNQCLGKGSGNLDF